MEYFVLPVAWSSQTLYLIYYSNDDDGVVLGGDGRILAAESCGEAQKLAQKKNLKLQDPMELLDLATLQSWLGSRSSKLPAATLMYRAWNFFGDVATCLKKADLYLGYEEDHLSIHEELFWGCNMPGISQSAERYEIDLSQSEIRALKSIFKSGLEIFQQGLRGSST